MQRLLLIALGGVIGTIARYLTSLVAIRWFGPEFPSGTLIVNLSGAFLIGLVQELGTEPRSCPTTPVSFPRPG